jgi:hypothetical protein
MIGIKYRTGSQIPDIALSYRALHNAIMLDEPIRAQVKLHPSYESVKNAEANDHAGQFGEPALEAVQ